MNNNVGKGKESKGRKKKGGDAKVERDLETTKISSSSSADLYSKTSKRKTKPHGTDQLQSSILFGYDLPNDITEDKILSFLEEFQHSIVTVEVVLNEKCDNHAKVTFATHSDAQAAIQQYNNQPWYDMGINVTLKPWKDRKEYASPPKKHTSSSPSMSGSHRNVKSTAVDVKHSSMFFGYDLPDVTEDDILSFLEEYEQSIISIEVEFNEKHGNYARVTFETATNAREAMAYYSGQYWYEFGVYVVLKPWKEKKRAKKRKKQQRHSKCIYDDDGDNLSICSDSTQQSETYSYKDSYFLQPYPGSCDSKADKPIYSENSTESKQQEKKLTGSSGSRKEEYTIKISGLSYDVKEKDILELVKPFGDLTNPVKIASYSQNGICYAYADYCSSSSARAAVAELDRSEFNNARIHVCHRGKLRVDHSCHKKLQELAEEDYDDPAEGTIVDSFNGFNQVQDTSILHLLHVGTQEPEKIAASSMSIGKIHSKLLTNLPRHDINDANSSLCRSDGSHEGSLAKFDSVLKSFEKSPDAYSLHTEQQAMTSYASVGKSPPKSIKKVLSGKKHSQSEGKNTINAPEKSKVDQPSKYHSDHKPRTIQTKQLVSNIDNLPDTAGSTKKQATNDSLDTLPQCVKVSNILTQKPEFYTDTMGTSQASNNGQIISDDPISNLNVLPTLSPHKQLIETVGDATSHHSFVTTQISPQAIKIVQDSKARQQPKFDPNTVKSDFILEVTNLHPDTSVQDLDRYFKPYGALKAPISIHLHPVSNSCSAIVHYVSANAAQNAMRRLNGCDISGYQMHVVKANDKDADMKIPADTAPVTSDSATVNNSSLVMVVPSNLPTPVKKTDTTLSVQKVGSPIIKSMSKNLQRFLKEQLSNKTTELNQLGGNIEWNDNSVIISGADQNVLNNFDNDVLCLLEETTEHLFADQWNKLMHVGCDGTNFLSQLIEEFINDVKIDLDYANKSITFIGKERMVLKIKHKLFKKICQDLSMLGYQMLVLITCIPNMVREIKTRWNVTITGFAEGSTCLNFKGDDIQMAYKYVMEHVGLCRSKEFPCCNIDVSLVTVAIAYIKKVGIAVVICNTGGERLLSNARILSTDILVVHSLSVKEIDRAICILESSPHKKEVKLPSKEMLAKLQESFEEFQGVYTVSLRTSASSVVIQGYKEKDVNALYETLKKHLTVRTVKFNGPKGKIQFLKHIMFDKPTEKAKTLLSSLSSSMSLKIQNGPVTFTLTGSLGAIEEGRRRIEQELLENFQVEAVHTRCHPDFLSQIEKHIREPLEKELNVIIYYFPVHGTERLEPPRSISTYIKVYSTDSADFEKARQVLVKLDPKSHLFLMGNEELKCIVSACKDGTIDLHQIGDSYRVRIELKRHQSTIVMHAFTQQEAEDCLQSLRQKISSLKLVIHLDLTTLQLQYMKKKKQDVLNLCKVTIETIQDAAPKLKLEGMRSQVERSKRVLQQTLNGIISRSHRQTHSKYILMWKKCWQEIYDKICQDKELHVELSTSVSDDGRITCELTVVGDDELKVESAISSVKKIDGSLKERIISTDAMGVKILNEGLKSGNLKIQKTLIYHIEVAATSITIVSPYSMQAKKIHKTVEKFISTEKEKRKITRILFLLKYSFLAKKLKSDWSEVQEIARSNKILSINLVTDPCCGIEVKGTKLAIKHAEPQILQLILSLESDLTSSMIPVDYYSRPALTSTELLQLCKELDNELCISLTVQSCPEVLSSAIVQLNDSSVKVEICEGSICLDNSEVIINFTDVTLTVHQELKTAIGESAMIDCKHHIDCCGPQSPGKAIIFYKFDDNKYPMVIHAVMSNWINGKGGKGDLISAVITESLNLAAECNVTSVSLPYLSCVDKDLSTEVLAEACLSAVYNFCEQSTSIEKIRFVLPNNMAEKFKNEFTTGLFQQWIVAEESNSRSPTPDDILVSSTSVESIWLWKDDDGKYHRYQTAENNILNQESAVSSTCSLTIGKFAYTINFVAMTQTNTSTSRVRNIKKITNDHIWLYKNNLLKWERFSLENSIKIEIMYVTRNSDTLVVNGKVCSYDFDDMIQLNHHDFMKTEIKRTIPSIKTEGKQDGNDESKILLFGLSADVTTANDKLEGCIESLSVVKCIDIQPKLVPLLDRHINQIQKDYRVEIHPLPRDFNDSSDTKAKYNVTGYKTCVQEAITAVYQILASSSAPSVSQSFMRPIEWEPQSDSIELKDVSQGSSEWNKILHRMQETIPNVNLVSIKRIQNEFLWEKYCQHKERMGRKGAERINEMELFHGTRTNPPEDIYMSEEGFDMRFSRVGMWGQGNYFAESAQYSRDYAYKKGDPMRLLHSFRYDYHTSSTSTVQQVFLVKVLTGDSYTSPSNNTLRMPPYKPSMSSEKVRYDTVNGMAPGSKVYITYSNDKAYPLYLISFT